MEREFIFPGPAGQLAGTLAAPADDAPRPALILVTGSGIHDRDETLCGHQPFRVISDHFVARGWAVLRYDDRGIGGSEGRADETVFADKIADVEAAFGALAATPDIDPARIALFGHSEGGLVAAAAATGVPARAVVMLAGPAVPVEEMLHDQAKAISLEMGANAARLAHERGMNEAAFGAARGGAAAVEVAGTIADRLRTWPGAPLATPEEIAANAEVMAGIICAPAYRATLRLEPGAILAAVEAPILAVYGGKDRQVAGHANRVAFMQATAANASAAAMLFDDLNHLFQRAGTGSIGEYESLAPGPEQEVLEAVSGWLERLPPAQLE